MFHYWLAAERQALFKRNMYMYVYVCVYVAGHVAWIGEQDFQLSFDKNANNPVSPSWQLYGIFRWILIE